MRFKCWSPESEGSALGINPESSAFAGASCKLQYAHFPPGILDNDASASLEPSVDKGVGIASNPANFFREYHSRFFRSMCGVDGIKIDAQGVVGILKPHRSTEYDSSTACAMEVALYL